MATRCGCSVSTSTSPSASARGGAPGERGRLQLAAEELRAADRRKDEFLGMLSHELRNPLAPIRNSIYILKRADPHGPQAERAKVVIERQVEHITSLVDDLLDVTRVTRGKIELQRSRLDLALLVRRAAEDHAALMVERGIALHLEVPRAALWTEGDPTRLIQTVGNLLQNAAKFTRAGGRVMLTLEVVRGAPRSMFATPASAWIASSSATSSSRSSRPSGRSRGPRAASGSGSRS